MNKHSDINTLEPAFDYSSHATFSHSILQLTVRMKMSIAKILTLLCLYTRLKSILFTETL